MHILALDVGDKKIGVAVGDTATRMAFTRPALLVDSWDDAWPLLKTIISEERIDHVIVGWPMNTDGSLGSQTDRIQEFINILATQIVAPIIKRDERHTSAAVQREQQAAGRQLKRGEEDSLAAQLILETYFMEKHD